MGWIKNLTDEQRKILEQNKQRKKGKKGFVNCPYCSEQILCTVKNCKHCGEFLEVPKTGYREFADDVSSTMGCIGKGVLIVIGAWLLLVYVVVPLARYFG